MLKTSLGEQRVSKSASWESQFETKIRPVVGLNTQECRTRYTVEYKNYMEKFATAQEKAHFNFLFPPRTFSLARHWKRWGIPSALPKRQRERTIPTRFRISTAGMRRKLFAIIKTWRVCWPLRFDGKSTTFLVFPRVQDQCRSPTDRLFNTFQRSTFIHWLGLCIQSCNNAWPGLGSSSVQHFQSFAFGQSHVRSAEHLCCTCERIGSRRSMQPLHAGNKRLMWLSRTSRSRLKTQSCRRTCRQRTKRGYNCLMSESFKCNLSEKFHVSNHSCSSPQHFQ